MGLDMNLIGKKYLDNSREDSLSKLLKNMYGIKREISSIQVELGYWRKFNALHKAFIGNGDSEDRETYITKEHFKKILDNMRRVQKDHSLAEELFPTESGFFFGETTYDRYYFKYIDETIEQFEKLLEEKIFEDYDVYYLASW